MKLFAATLATVQASHYRGGGYAITQGDAGLVEISRSNTWRRNFSGYSGGCTQSHIDNQVVGMADPEDCVNQDNTSCGNTKGGYIVTDIEDTLSDANNYCYGTRYEDFNKPSQPYEIEWDDCCWVKFTTDDNNLVIGGDFGFIAQVKDINNNTPETKLPPIWKIMAGCPAQTIELSPTDKDGDKVKCRWANSSESLGAWSGNHNFGSITLDENTCILTYDGTKDKSTDGVKPISIQVEDFDSKGKLKSSMPLQFLATVWTPNNSNFRTYGRDNTPYQYPDLFPTDDDEDDKKPTPSRGRRSVPDYCKQVPVLEDPSPEAGSVTEVGLAGTKFTLKASSGNGSITRFTYQSAQGISCGAVNSNGEVNCTFKPSKDQAGSNVGFCFQAEDNSGLQTERRCISFDVKAQDPVLYDIHDMLDALDAGGNRYANYGCTGNGDMDHTAPNHGAPDDEIDHLLLERKNCLRCNIDQHQKAYEKYSFDASSETCQDPAGTPLRRFCECDKHFVTSAKGNNSFNKAMINNSKNCQKIGGSGNPICCIDNERYTRLNGDRHQCCRGGGYGEIGTC